MPRRLIRLTLALMLIVAGEAGALGLGEVRLNSALNEPLLADIILLSVSPEELTSLRVGMASDDVFARYDLDRPAYLQDVRFQIIPTGGPNGGAIVRMRSSAPITEPFLTFLVEATWSGGRLLREYTVLLDPPTYAPPVSAAPTVTAPERSTPTDSGRIDRTPAPAPSQPAQPAERPVTTTPPATSRPAPRDSSTPAPSQPRSFSSDGGTYTVSRGDTLWGIASALRPDGDLTMNQTMLALYEANPGAFGGNINNLREGATLRLPGPDEIYQIDRGSALAEVQRQHAAWGGADAMPRPVAPDPDPAPSLTLVPPDEAPAVSTPSESSAGTDETPVSREQQILDEIAEIDATPLPANPAMVELRNESLAALERELAEIRGVPYEPPTIEAPDEVDTNPFVDTSTTDEGTDEGTDAGVEDTAVDQATTPEPIVDNRGQDTTQVQPTPEPQPSLVDQIIGYAMGPIGIGIGVVLLLVGGVLFWFMRRGRSDDSDDSWNAPLDSEPLGNDTIVTDMTATESMAAPVQMEDTMIVVEQTPDQLGEPTVETQVMDFVASEDEESVDLGALDDTMGGQSFEETAAPASLEDTFSSETAVNLDESDPIAEADFHMAYGLYDQAADLINGALEIEPQRTDLLTKLCETYFVWGNRESFIDAAERLKAVVGDGDSAEWDKIVIMGQQIAADHELFSGAGVVGAGQAVDMPFDAGQDDDDGALDMDFGTGGDDIGAETSSVDDGMDFLFEADDGESDTGATAEFDEAGEAPTVETPALDVPVDDTVEQDFGVGGATAELPAIGDDANDVGVASDATAEIELDDLGLDLAGLGDGDATQVASLDDDDDYAVTQADDGLGDPLDDEDDAPSFDPVATDLAGEAPTVDVSIEVGDDLSPTAEMRLAADETGQLPQMNPADDESLLDITGATQVMGDDFDIQTIVGDNDDAPTPAIGDEDATMLASDLDDDDDDFNFAKTEALSPEKFVADTELDETGELPAVASTDVDLDLENLTAALQVSELGETLEQPRDDATVEQPAPFDPEATSLTAALSPDELDGQLHEARTMTEVGTKLDLARAYVDMGDPAGAKSILEEVLEEGDEGQRQQAQQLLDSL